MATKIRRSLFIGLGGTGMRTLLHLKKLFIETYGEVPGMIGFLGMDTDLGEFVKEEELKNLSTLGTIDQSEIYIEGKNRGNKVTLEKNEQIQITVDDPKRLYERNKEEYNWLPKQNLYALKTLIHGAGQVRTNGRFAFIANINIIKDKVNQALNNVSKADATGSKYELIDNKTDVYLIFSLGGGTGCGCFLDMAYLIRQLVGNNCKLAAFAVLPEIFKTALKDGVARVRPNAYGAIKDLDWLMSRDWNADPIDIPQQDGHIWKTNDSPFDACIFVDNKNRNLDVYNATRQVEEMLALSLITSVGELSTANVSVLDNIAVDVTGGSFNIKQKRAWVCGMGVCEVLILNNDLRKIYSHLAVIHLVNQLLNRDENVINEVMNWIDSPNVKIREHDADDVIDYLLSKDVIPFSGIVKSDYSNPKLPINAYIESQQPNIEELNDRYNTLTSRVYDELRTKVILSLNRIGGMGVGATKDLLSGIKEQVSTYLNEMLSELSVLKKQELEYNNAIDQSCENLKEESSKWFKTKIDEIKEEISNYAIGLAITKKEIIRRDKAATFFRGLLDKIIVYQDKVKEIHDKLVAVKENSTREIAKLRQEIDRNTETFQINLTSTIERSLNLNTNEILISDFINSIKEGNKIFDFIDLETSSICVRFNQYTYNLPTAKLYGNQDINQALKILKENNEFDSLVKQIIAKSSPLLPYNFLGYTNKRPMTNYYIGVNKYEDSLLNKEDYFKNKVENSGNVQFSNIGMKDRIIVFSQMNPIPAFAIESISNRCKREYDDPDQNLCFHFDTRILEEMRHTSFSIEPSNNDNSLELWVKGFIFGYIRRNTNGDYQYKDEENGSPLRDYWVPLSSDRLESYNLFKEKKGCIEEQFARNIHQAILSHGLPSITNLYNDVKTKYLTDYSCSEYTQDELINRRELHEVAELVEKELGFIHKNLTI